MLRLGVHLAQEKEIMEHRCDRNFRTPAVYLSKSTGSAGPLYKQVQCAVTFCQGGATLDADLVKPLPSRIGMGGLEGGGGNCAGT